MSTFHDDKLWQEAYMASLDLLEAVPNGESDVADQVRKHAMMVVSVTADAVTRRDRRDRDIKLKSTGDIVTALRSLLSILWGQEVLSDDQFGAIDGAYEAFAKKLPR